MRARVLFERGNLFFVGRHFLAQTGQNEENEQTRTGDFGSPERGLSPQRFTQILETAGGPVALAATCLAALILAVVASPPLSLWIVLGFVGSVFSGMFGTGVVLTVPILLYVPPLLGKEPPSIHAVTAASTVVVAVVGLAGALSHMREGGIKWSLIPAIGGGMAPAALLGAAASRFVSSRALLAIFAVLVAAAVIPLMAGRGLGDEESRSAEVQVNFPVAISVGAVTGFLVGMAGLGGGFLLVPLMIYLLHVPLRVAVGSSLGILAVTGLASMLGKAVTGQIDWLFAAALVAGALPGVYVGAWLSPRVHVRRLSQALGVLLAVVAVKMWWDILRG